MAVAAILALLGVALLTLGYEDARFLVLPGAVSPLITAAIWTVRRYRHADRQ